MLSLRPYGDKNTQGEKTRFLALFLYCWEVCAIHPAGPPRTPQISYGRHGQLSSVSNTQPELLLCSRRSCWSFSPLYLNSSDSVDHRTDGWIIQWQEKSSALSPSSLVDMAREPFISMLLGSEWMWILQGWPCCALKSAIFCPLIWPKYWILFAHLSFYSLYVISFETCMYDNGHHIPKYWWGLCQIPHSGSNGAQVWTERYTTSKVTKTISLQRVNIERNKVKIKSWEKYRAMSHFRRVHLY